MAWSGAVRYGGQGGVRRGAVRIGGRGAAVKVWIGLVRSGWAWRGGQGWFRLGLVRRGELRRGGRGVSGSGEVWCGRSRRLRSVMECQG